MNKTIFGISRRLPCVAPMSRCQSTLEKKAQIPVTSTRPSPSVIESERETKMPFILKVFSRERKGFPNLFRLNPLRFSHDTFTSWKLKKQLKFELTLQKVIPERQKQLGYDISAAHFVVQGGGKIKFRGDDKWYDTYLDEKKQPLLPTSFVAHLYVESVDLSRCRIRYEGFVNLFKLNKLKWLRLAHCPLVDDWFIDRVSGEFGECLEYLDLSYCDKLTENFFSCMYRFNNLKTLVLTDTHNSKSFQLHCLLLEEAMPNLTIKGVKYEELASKQ